MATESAKEALDILRERIAELEAALRVARAQLVTLGGEAPHPHGCIVQRAVLAEIDKAISI